VCSSDLLVDSVLGVAREGSVDYVDALFVRASIAESSTAARRDYVRIALDYSNSPRAEDSLLRLAQMEVARGDRASAKQYLERLALEHPEGASRARGAFWLGRVLADEGALAPACASLMEAKARVAPSDVELANQIGYYLQPCATLQRAADSARTDSTDRVKRTVRVDSLARADSISKGGAASKKKKTAGQKEPSKPAIPEAKGLRWSVQVAAYDTPEEAGRLASKLGDRGYEARVTTEKPFRVRIGRYARRAEAADLALKLKDAKITAIVVEAEKP
jgi:cell division septation protein DedD